MNKHVQESDSNSIDYNRGMHASTTTTTTHTHSQNITFHSLSIIYIYSTAQHFPHKCNAQNSNQLPHHANKCIPFNITFVKTLTPQIFLLPAPSRHNERLLQKLTWVFHHDVLSSVEGHSSIVGIVDQVEVFRRLCQETVVRVVWQGVIGIPSLNVSARRGRRLELLTSAQHQMVVRNLGV